MTDQGEGHVYEDEADRIEASTHGKDGDVEYEPSELGLKDADLEAEAESMYNHETDKRVSTMATRYQGFYKDNDGVAHMVHMRRVSVKTRPRPRLEDSPLQPIEPPKMPKSRLKPVSRDHKVIYVVGDAQIGYRRIHPERPPMPLHDEVAISAAVALAKHLRPDVVVDLGDTTDFAELSRFAPDADHFQRTLEPSLRRTQQFYADLTEVTPHAKRVIVDSNHTKRLGDYTKRNSPEFYNLTRQGDEYPVLSYPGLLNLDKLGVSEDDKGWKFLGGYGGAVYRYNGEADDFEQPEDEFGYEDLAFMHGNFSVGGGGSTAAKLGRFRDNVDRNIVQGHAHRIESQYHTDRRGRKFGAFVCGALCHVDGRIPSYYSSINEKNVPNTYYENWQNGVMVIRDYGDGNYVFDQVPINNGVIYYEGKQFVGLEPETE